MNRCWALLRPQRPELHAAFVALGAVVNLSGRDETATGTFWVLLHGLAELECSGWIRPGVSEDQMALVVSGLAGAK